MKFTRIEGKVNEILDCGDFFISYNPNPGMGISFFEGDNNSDETALVNLNDKKHKYRILNGDFREDYLEIAPKWDACLSFYEKMKEKHNSSWSTGRP